jgi:hypothetical protein
MTQVSFRASDPLLDLSRACGDCNRQFPTSQGTIETRTVTIEDGRTVLLPTMFVSEDGTGSVQFRDESARIVLRAGERTLVLDSAGFFLGEGAPHELREPSEDQAREIAEVLVTDGDFQRAFLGLARGFWAGTMEASAATGIGTVEAVRSAVNDVSSVYASMTRTETRIVCSTETLVEYVTKEVWGWVTSVLTVAEQLKACHDRCWATTSGLKFLACEAGCIATAFVSIVINTWTLIKTVVEQVIRTVTTCVEVVVKVPVELEPKVPPRSGSIPTSIGPGYPAEIVGSSGIIPQLDPNSVKASDLQDAFGPLVPALQCLAGGKWGTWDPSIPPVAGIDSVPVGLRLCIDKDCLDKIRAAVSLPTVLGAASVLGALIEAVKDAQKTSDLSPNGFPGSLPSSVRWRQHWGSPW